MKLAVVVLILLALFLVLRMIPMGRKLQGEPGGPSGTGPGYIQGFQSYPTSGLSGV
jgi:hypothetical protein